MTVNGHSRDVTIAVNGKILEVEEQIAWHDLPAAVRDGLEHMAGSGRIMKVESLTSKENSWRTMRKCTSPASGGKFRLVRKERDYPIQSSKEVFRTR